MDDLLKKGREMAQDPANQERLKKAAQERFGSGGSQGADHSEGGSSGDESVADTRTAHGPSSHDSDESGE